MGNSRLSRIDTQWSVVKQAHDSGVDGSPARAMLVERYGPAIRRYLLASLRDEDTANELFQDFALRLIKGKFKNADEHRGKFRNMLKTALYRMMVDYHRKKQRAKEINIGENGGDVEAQGGTSPIDDDTFSIAWRKSLLDESWSLLQQLEKQSGQLYYTVLRARSEAPLLTTSQLYESLHSAVDGLPEYPSFRVLLHRARKRFSAIILKLVSDSLDTPSTEAVEVELIELGLHHYCKPLL